MTDVRCYVLNDERRVFDADDVAGFFGGPWSGATEETAQHTGESEEGSG